MALEHNASNFEHFQASIVLTEIFDGIVSDTDADFNVDG